MLAAECVCFPADEGKADFIKGFIKENKLIRKAFICLRF
jgi:hypothetical protein